MLDVYLNFAYRSAKGHRDGFPVSAHLDTASPAGPGRAARLFEDMERAALAAGHRAHPGGAIWSCFGLRVRREG